MILPLETTAQTSTQAQTGASNTDQTQNQQNTAGTANQFNANQLAAQGQVASLGNQLATGTVSSNYGMPHW